MSDAVERARQAIREAVGQGSTVLTETALEDLVSTVRAEQWVQDGDYWLLRIPMASPQHDALVAARARVEAYRAIGGTMMRDAAHRKIYDAARDALAELERKQ